MEQAKKWRLASKGKRRKELVKKDGWKRREREVKEVLDFCEEEENEGRRKGMKEIGLTDVWKEDMDPVGERWKEKRRYKEFGDKWLGKD